MKGPVLMISMSLIVILWAIGCSLGGSTEEDEAMLDRLETLTAETRAENEAVIDRFETLATATAEDLDRFETLATATAEENAKTRASEEANLERLDALAPPANICNRSILMQQHLLEDEFHVSLCSYVTTEELYRLTHLSIKEGEGYERYGRLQPDDFKDMVNLVYLGLESPGGYSRIYPLPPEIFRHLGGLRRLSLWKYDPDSVLDRDWATELPRLEVLTLRTAGDQPESAEWPGNTTYELWFSDNGVCMHRGIDDWSNHQNPAPAQLEHAFRSLEATFGTLKRCED